MSEQKPTKIQTAYVSNVLATQGMLDFSNAREWVLFLFLVAQLDPKNQGELTDAIVSVQDLEKLLKTSGTKWGGLYNELRSCSRRMAKVLCEFDTDVEIAGEVLPRVRTIFSEISPFKTDDGTVFIKYCFNEKMKPLLLGFKRDFMGIKPPVGIKSGHAIRFLLLAKAERDKKRKYEKVTVLTYEVESLKAILGVVGKYDRFNNFRIRVIEPIIKGVNKSGIVDIIKFETKKTGRNVSHVIFTVADSPKHKPAPISLPVRREQQPADSVPPDNELATLTFAQTKAFRFLTESGIYKGIAFREIIPRMPSSICEGYEDFFCEEAYKIVVEMSKAQTKEARAKVFVAWFKKDIFKDDQFSRIIETVHARKKSLKPQERMNREFAKEMTYSEFVDWYRNQQAEENKTPPEQDPNQRTGFSGIGDLLKNED